MKFRFYFVSFLGPVNRIDLGVSPLCVCASAGMSVTKSHCRVKKRGREGCLAAAISMCSVWALTDQVEVLVLLSKAITLSLICLALSIILTFSAVRSLRQTSNLAIPI